LRYAENERNSNSDENDFLCTFIIGKKKKQFLNFKTLLLRFKKLICEATQLIQHTVVNYSSLQQVRSMIRKNNAED